MRILALTALFLVFTISTHAQIYRWVDEKGTIHFSDQPHSEDAKAINVRVNGVTFDKPQEQTNEEPTGQLEAEKDATKATKASKPQVESQPNIVTEVDYKITASVGKLGNDIVQISGRVGKGPVCNNMEITANAQNDNGLSASITSNVRLSNSSGSTIFEGTKKVSGSAEDRGFWEVETVTVRCND